MRPPAADERSRSGTAPDPLRDPERAEGQGDGPEGERDVGGGQLESAGDPPVRRRMARASTGRGRAGRALSDLAEAGGAGAKRRTRGRAAAEYIPTDYSEKLIVENLKMASHVANKYALRAPVPFEDLEAVAYIGLIKGCRRYDPERRKPDGTPYALSTICYPFIHGAVQQYLRDKGYSIRFPSAWRQHGPRVRAEVQKGTTLEKIALMTGLGAEEVQEMIWAMGPTVALCEEVNGTHDPFIEEDATVAAFKVSSVAYERLPAADQGLLERWSRREIPFPTYALGAFLRMVQLQYDGKRLPEIRQQMAIPISVETVEVVRQRRAARVREELEERAVQLRLV
jgi:hypothetical protein